MSALGETGMTLARVTVYRVDALPAGATDLRSQSALVHQVQHRLIRPAAEADLHVLGCKHASFG